MSATSVLLAGANGLVGGHVVPLLSPERLHLLLRRPVKSKAAQTVSTTQDWPSAIATIRPDIAVSTLGTTIRQAGSQSAFRAVDFELVLAVATAARDAGARQFIMVSSVGASARASNFYLKTKGEAEDAVGALGFGRVDILRPGLLRGERSGPSRPGERIAMALSPVTDFLTPHVLSQYRSIEARTVAQAIVALTDADGEGGHIHHNAEMLALARALG